MLKSDATPEQMIAWLEGQIAFKPNHPHWETVTAIIERLKDSMTFEAQLRPAVEAKLTDDILIGGNHLASALIGYKCFPDLQGSYDTVLATFGQPCADMWVAWRAIMNLGKWRTAEGLDE